MSDDDIVCIDRMVAANSPKFVLERTLLIKYFCVFIIFQILQINTSISAQIDSTYIRSFEHDFSARSYFINKLTGFQKTSENKDLNETFRINAPTAIGAGAAWKSFSFGFSYGVSFMRDKNRGKTNSLEFQYHGYKRKFAYDISLQQHKGFYNEEMRPDGTFIIYPDVKINMYGGSFLWVFNNKKFSYKAAFNQNERQIKSAGSFQLGASMYYSKIKTDSTELFAGMEKVHENIQFGAIGGYAYTWVLGQRWFLTGSASLGVNIGNNYPSRLFKKKMEVYPTFNNRFAAGYNINSWSFGLSSYYNKTYLFFDGKESLSINDISMQITLIKRFHWGNKFVNKTLQDTQKKLDRIGIR